MKDALILSEETDDVLGKVSLGDQEARHVFGMAGTWRASAYLNRTQIDTCGIDDDDRVYAVPA